MAKTKIIIIGAGAAGLMAAGCAARAGGEVLVLEKKKKPGRKLCITGKGRCNITNVAEVREFIAHFGKTGNFLRQAFARFFNTELMDFLSGLGLALVTERGGRVFPKSEKASDVLKVLLKWTGAHGVTIRPESTVSKFIVKEQRVCGVVCNGQKIEADAVILATGGASYPLTGSTGDGYMLAESCGHSIKPIRPALVPLVTAGNITKEMAELNLRNIKVRMLINGKKAQEEFGELIFAKYGVTGPVILTLSGLAVEALQNGKKVELLIDLKPALDEKKLDARLLRDIEKRGKEEMSSLLRGLLPKEMVDVCLSQTDIPANRMVHSLGAKERKRLRMWLKEFRLEVTGHRPLAEAIVTAGGVETKEIEPKTMESRLTKGLFIVGEVLDIQGDTGGYNLQAAFSTGWLAGQAAAKVGTRS